MKLTLIFALLFSLSAFAVVNDNVGSNYKDQTGSIKKYDKMFVTVEGVAGANFARGSVVVLDVTSDDGFKIASSTTAGAVPHCVLDEACNLGAYPCKCQVYGYHDAVLFDSANGSAVAGAHAFISEDTAGYAEAEASPAAGDIPLGQFLDASAATGGVEMFIRLLGH